MENSKPAERWALVTAVSSLPHGLDPKVEGGVGGKSEPQERLPLGVGTRGAGPRPLSCRLPLLGRGHPGCLQRDPAPLGNSRGSSGPGWEAFLVAWRPSVTQVRPVRAPPGRAPVTDDSGL